MLLLLSAATLLSGGAAQMRAQSALDGFDPNANGEIFAVVLQPDGKILVGGAFTTLSPNGGAAVTRNRIARLNPDGTLDDAFNPNADGIVYAIALQADGKILAGGDFLNIGGQTRTRMARLDAATGVADSFNPNADVVIRAIVIQADGNVLVGGDFTSIGGQPRNRLARVDATTGLADSFDPNANERIRSIAVQADGKILAGGEYTNIGGQARNHLARLDPITGLADSFDPNMEREAAPPPTVFSIVVRPDGKILAGGFFTMAGGKPRNSIALLDPTTGLPESFDAHMEVERFCLSIALQADGQVIMGGFFVRVNALDHVFIVRLDGVTGLPDESFQARAAGNINAVVVQADGKILVAGKTATLGVQGVYTLPRNNIGRVEIGGNIDQTLTPNIIGSSEIHVVATAVQPDGKILIGGHFNNVLGPSRRNIARLNTNGALDQTFNPNANGEVYAIAVQPDGKILVGGAFSGTNSIGGQPRNFIARLFASTGLADSFDPQADGSVRSIAVQADGKILAGGEFANIGGQPRNFIARLEAATGLADSFNANAICTQCGADSGVHSVTIQADGRILVGGFFSSIGGQPRNHIARLNATTGLADSFNPNSDNTITSIAVQPDGKVLAGGLFSNIGGQPRSHIARLSAGTGLADSFDPNANGVVYSIALQGNGKILAGGTFNGANSIGGQARNRVARLDATTGLADSFDPNASGNVDAIALQADGKVLVGGEFQNIGGQARTLFARLSNDTAALQNLAATQTKATWTRGGSSPQFARVTFESSTDNINYTPLGEGSPVGSNWIRTGLNLPIAQHVYIRARGYYHSCFKNGSESLVESVRNAFVTEPDEIPVIAHAINLSTRMRVQTGDNAGIGGFIIIGDSTKHVLLRAIGPSLAQSGVPNVLADPVLELHGPGTFVTTTNDNWRDDPVQEALILATGIAPTDNLESAIEARLFPGVYSAIVRGKNNTSGVGLIEVYDLNPGAASKLADISTRAFVSTGNEIVIAGFVLDSASGDDNVVVRGLGPSLTAAGVPNALSDPTLELHNGNGALVVSNNDWQDDPDQAALLTAAGLAPTNDLESGIAATLSPGGYTALLAGRNNGTGVGLVEVYDVGTP